MNTKAFKECIDKRIKTDDEDAFGVEECWKELTDILTEDIASTIQYMLTDCTADEFSWISEVFDDVAEKTRSREFLDCCWKLTEKFPEECDKYNIKGVLPYAEAYLKEGVCQ